MTHPFPVEEQFLSLKEIRRRLGVGESTIRRMVHRGDFPAPVRFGGRRVAWAASEYARWVAERKAERPVS